MKLFPNFTSIPFDYLLISWVTNYVSNLGFLTCLSWIVSIENSTLSNVLPACRRLLFPLLHAGKGRLRNAVANRVPASRWQGILFRINCEIISG